MDRCGSSTPETPEYQPTHTIVNEETWKTKQDPPMPRPQEGQGQTIDSVSSESNNEQRHVILDVIRSCVNEVQISRSVRMP